jgi:hypothetical protein
MAGGRKLLTKLLTQGLDCNGMLWTLMDESPLIYWVFELAAGLIWMLADG